MTYEKDAGHKTKPTHGSLFAGIGGFELGFERAGFQCSWSVEINPINRAVLADRFPHSRQFEDVRECGAHNLSPVDVLTAGFPCQDISAAGTSSKQGRPGLKGERSGLYREALRIIDAIRPRWVVLENVEALLWVNDHADLATIIQDLAHRGYLGCFRVLDAAGFGVPQRRRRLFMVGGLGQPPPAELLFDASPVEGIPSAFAAGEVARAAHSAPGYTLLAANTACRITLGGQLLVAEQDGWNKMVERARESERCGIPLGLDDTDFASAHAAGNAVVPQVAEWIGRKLIQRMR
ncbi:DNA cytosine methyltransferase [Verrucomicrobium spinosum]|uniref:DNA cytosine methyltransferase n=1 Tax=Verrucomicrobium spinosum TaxID=2736 RepID=UPI00017452D9|nr:DNA cytosine methyltransferase [Verrucomicrobium spinosum]